MDNSVLAKPITPRDRPKTPASLSNEEILKIIAENAALKNQVQKQEGHFDVYILNHKYIHIICSVIF